MSDIQSSREPPGLISKARAWMSRKNPSQASPVHGPESAEIQNTSQDSEPREVVAHVGNRTQILPQAASPPSITKKTPLDSQAKQERKRGRKNADFGDGSGNDFGDDDDNASSDEEKSGAAEIGQRISMDPDFRGVDLSSDLSVAAQLDPLRQENFQDRTYRERSLFSEARSSISASTDIEREVEESFKNRRDFVETSIVTYFKEVKNVEISSLGTDYYIKEILSVLVYMVLQWAHGYPLSSTQDLLEMIDKHSEDIIGADNFPTFPKSPVPWRSYEAWTLVDKDWYLLWAQVIELIYRSGTRHPESQGSAMTGDRKDIGTDYDHLVLAMDKDTLHSLQWKIRLARQGFDGYAAHFVQSAADPDHITFLIAEGSETKKSKTLSAEEAQSIGWFRGRKSKGRFWRYRQGDIDGKRPDLYFIVTWDEAVIGIWTEDENFYCKDMPWP